MISTTTEASGNPAAHHGMETSGIKVFLRLGGERHDDIAATSASAPLGTGAPAPSGIARNTPKDHNINKGSDNAATQFNKLHIDKIEHMLRWR